MEIHPQGVKAMDEIEKLIADLEKLKVEMDKTSRDIGTANEGVAIAQHRIPVYAEILLSLRERADDLMGQLKLKLAN